ncbi:hypothetical protein PR048_031657 [Dryococelus australis]|uniref:Peroxin-14 n=1 Tax=Dryococelus australis TaxID=614101 RepID=A0ABQ9G8P7_9NEOP|nr:hypothetical protein PR048_031657 [Dryococelus australis]
MPSPHTSLMMPPLLPVVTPWSRFRDIGNTVALLTGLIYAVYMLYKRYIEPYLFKTVQQKSKEELFIEIKTELLKSVGDLKCDLGRVSTELSSVQQQQLAVQCVDVSDNLRNLKAEVASLKALLLSR